jgi:hypothetical protein
MAALTHAPMLLHACTGPRRVPAVSLWYWVPQLAGQIVPLLPSESRGWCFASADYHSLRVPGVFFSCLCFVSLFSFSVLVALL